jgi:hypothetical protein
MIEDYVMRTVDSIYPDPRLFENKTVAQQPQAQLEQAQAYLQQAQLQQVQLQQVQLQQVQLQQARFGQPQPHFQQAQPQLQQPQAQFEHVANMALPRRQMPPRSAVTNTRPLEYLFDLAADQRAGVQIVVPSRENQPIVVQPGVPKRRSTWQQEHVDYLNELVELAMLILNRAVETKDFFSITEALHRKFRGTTIGNVAYPERGYNSVHSFVTKKDTYAAFVRRVLP